MRLYEIEFKTERDFEDWLKRKQDRYEKYKRDQFKVKKYKDSPFLRGYYAGKKFIPDTVEKVKRNELVRGLKNLADITRGPAK
jgi:hypothetical protein